MKKLALLFLFPVLSGPLAADDQLQPIVVTATRMELPADEVLAPTVVIDREQIERSMASDIAELLRFHAGLELGRNGGPGQATSLFIRGSDSNHALVLVDGVEINPGTIGGAALQNIVPHLIERIEIVKGPRSALYGSEAIGGVVNIITRQNAGLELSIGGGRYGTRSAALSAGLGNDEQTVSASIGTLSSDGFPTRDTDGAPDRGYTNRSAGLNAATTIGGADLSLRHWQSEGNTEYLDFFVNPVDQDYRNRATALTVTLSPAAGWSSSIMLSAIADDIDQQQSADTARTDRNVVDWQNNVQAGMHNIVAGLYAAREQTRALSFGTGFDENTDIDALYLQDYIDLSHGELLLAARYTDHETAGNNTTWNAEYGHRFANGWRLIGAIGSAFRAPDATDRFGFGGNPQLQPEQSASMEFGLDRVMGPHTLRITAFRNTIDNLIEYVFDPVSFAGSNVNIARARITGLDAGYRWRNDYWRVAASVLLQNPHDLQNDTQLARRARRSLTLNASRVFDVYTLGFDVLATSQRRDSPFSDTINSGYVLANLSAQMQLTRNWSLQGKIENLLDTNYQTAAGFRSAGRGLYLAARYRLH